MKTTIRAALLLLAVSAVPSAHAFCVYNDATDAHVSAEVIHAKLVGAYNSGDLAPGANSCCNYKNTDCNPSGSQTSTLDVVTRVSIARRAGYRVPPQTAVHCGDVGDSVNEISTWAKMQGGGYLVFKRNSSFDYDRWVAPDNAPYVLQSYTFDHKLIRSWNCPSGAWDNTLSGPLGDKTVLLRASSGKCMDAALASEAMADAGSKVWIWDCTRLGNQRWIAKADRLMSATGFCLAAGGPLAARTPLVLATCDGSAGQRFVLKGDAVTLAPDDRLCANVAGGVAANGTLVWLWPCDAKNRDQYWAATR